MEAGVPKEIAEMNMQHYLNFASARGKTSCGERILFPRSPVEAAP